MILYILFCGLIGHLNITVYIYPIYIEYVQPLHIPNAKKYGITGLLKFDEFKSKNIISKEQLIMIEEIFKENQEKFDQKTEREILEERTVAHESGMVYVENLEKIEISGEFQPYVLKIVEHYNKTIVKIRVSRENKFFFHNYVDIFE